MTQTFVAVDSVPSSQLGLLPAAPQHAAFVFAVACFADLVGPSV